MSNENTNAESKVLIDIADMPAGFYLCLNNAERFLKISKQLLSNRDYQAAIPLATISIEEALKGLEIVIKFSRNQGITAGDWDNLMNHKHKLTNVFQWALDNLKSMNDDDFDKAKDELSKTDLKCEDSVDAITRNLQRLLAAYGHFQKLREMCLYSSWDKQSSKWVMFDELTEEKQEALTFFTVTEAQTRINFLKRFIEKYINRQRKNAQLLIELPYPPYKDYRPPEEWESNGLPICPQSKIEQTRYERGFEVMKWFININSFQSSSDILRKVVLECLRMIIKQKVSEMFPHPMIDAIAQAAFAASADNEAPVMALSDDSAQTHDGKPTIVFAAIAKMDSGICSLSKVEVLSPPPKRKLTQAMIEKIIRTEKIIERSHGKTVPTSLCIEALSTIGIKCK